MADNFDQKLNQIKDMLQDENLSETIKNFIDTVSKDSSTSSAPNEESQNNDLSETENFPESEDTTVDNITEAKPSTNSDLNKSIDTFSKISQIYNHLNRTDTPSVNLLMAIKPYLNPRRRSKLDRAAKVLNFGKLPNMIKEFDKD